MKNICHTGGSHLKLNFTANGPGLASRETAPIQGVSDRARRAVAKGKRMNKITILLEDYVPPSNNILLRTHWAKRRKSYLNLYRWIFSEVLYAANVKPKEKRKVVINVWRKRLLDKDNLYGGCKDLLDVLKKLGLIYDDSPKYLDLKVEQNLCGKDSKYTEIEIK